MWYWCHSLPVNVNDSDADVSNIGSEAAVASAIVLVDSNDVFEITGEVVDTNGVVVLGVVVDINGQYVFHCVAVGTGSKASSYKIFYNYRPDNRRQATCTGVTSKQ